jgi:hypothetical protein
MGVNKHFPLFIFIIFRSIWVEYGTANVNHEVLGNRELFLMYRGKNYIIFRAQMNFCRIYFSGLYEIRFDRSADTAVGHL